MREIIPQINEDNKNVGVFFGGEDRDTKESLASLKVTFAYAFAGVFLIIIFLFGSMLQTMVVLSIVFPLGFVSAIAAFALHGMPITFLGMMGIVALGGVIVNNAIVFIDAINQYRGKGMSKLESIVLAGKTRIRPIFLTTVTTVSGILPVAYGIGGIDQFVVPLALALGWGLVVGGVLTSFVIPAAIAIVDDIEKSFQRLKVDPYKANQVDSAKISPPAS